MAPDTNRETRANAPEDTGDSSVFRFSFLESNRSRRQKIFKIALESGSIECFTVQYDCCRNPACDCREVVLDIAEAPESSGNETVVVEVTETATFSYDYTTGRVQVKADGPADCPPALDLIAALKAADPDLDVRSKRRQRVLRQLHRSVRQDRVKPMNAQPARALKKVGRNEKCPCGSGKKYKVCCGR